jgi:uncharacterized iron-regulated protein
MRIAAVVLSVLSLVAADDPTYHLAIGDPGRRDREVSVVLDAIVSGRNGAVLTPGDLVGELADAQLILIGQTHTSAESHRVQLQVIEALHRAGRRVRVGLEMFPYTEQASLDSWVSGTWSADDFLAKARWYEHWGYHWGYYEDIFRFARAQRLPMLALNVPRDVVAAVRRQGLEQLPPEQAKHLPPSIDVDNAEHLMLFKASFDEDDTLHGAMTDDAWKGMLAAQATWDAAMAWHAVLGLKDVDDPRTVVVVLVGSGHVAYGLGIERQARRWFDGRIRSIIPVPVADADGPIASVRGSYADYVWGVAEERSPRYPSLGVSTMAADGGRRQIIAVEDDSPAAAAGLQVGDTILDLGGQPIASREALSQAIAACDWGDVPVVTVEREGQRLSLDVALRRSR